MTTWWESGSFAFSNGDTVTGTVDGRTWTLHGDDIRGSARLTLRTELANAIADQVTEEWGITVTPYPPDRGASPPHIYLEPDDPFFERAANGFFVYAYTVHTVVSGRHQASWDWFERLGPLLNTAAENVSGAVFHVMDAPTYEEVGERGRYLTSESHITIKRKET